MSIKQEILNRLLDKYEQSAHFKGEAKVMRRIMIDLKPPLYTIEDPTKKQAVHMVLEELSKKKITNVLWLEKDHIVRRVQLNLANVDQAYKEIKRRDKKTVHRQVKDLCAPESDDPEWLQEFLKHITISIDTRYKVPATIPDDRVGQKNLLIALRALARLDGEEVLERVFSKRHFNDSKYFEVQLRAKTANILSQFKLSSEDLSANEVLQEAGLFRSSDELLFTGPMAIKVGGPIIDFTPLKHGAAFGARTVKELEIVELRVDTVITIENKASYREYCSRMDGKTLAIYLAGFPGPMKKLFLRKLHAHAQKAGCGMRFLHWGDIDLGGFRIYKSLKDEVPALEPYLMDGETLWNNREQCQELGKGYAQQLRKLLADPGYDELRGVIELMLRENIRLEQEGITSPNL